jgi:uncharacterized damage-inducible protein DinB
MPFSENLLPEFDEEMKNTRKILECVPDGKFDYQPHPKSMSLGRLATHVAEVPSWTAFTLDSDVFDMPPDFKPRLATSRAELLSIFDKSVADARPKIIAATDEDWQKIWTFKFAGKTVMSMPKSVVMRSTIMNHLIHHRAQLGVFLRLNEVAIPGMYGPSADEQKFWEASNASAQPA